MSTRETVAEVLDRAHDELLVRGWARGDYEREDGRVCAVGAIGYAMGRTSYTDEKGFRRTSDLDPCGTSLGNAVCDALLPWTGTRCVPEWNDESDRTIDDVLDAFRHASKALREEAGQQ